MSSITNLGWLNKNSRRAYPIKEGTTQLDLSGSYQLSTDLVCDFVLVMDINKDKRFYLRYLSVLPGVITGQIYDEDDNATATFSIDVAAHTTYDFYVVSGVGIYKNLVGKIVVGELAAVLSQSIGLFEFDLTGAELEPGVVTPSIRAVTSITKAPIGETSFPPLTGHVLVSDGYNTKVSIDVDTYEIRIDAIAGEGLGPVCDCVDPEPEPPCIAYINGIPPDESKNFNIRGIDCITVTGTNNGIQVSNTCVEPCCDCEEIADLQAQIADLDARVLALGG